MNRSSFALLLKKYQSGAVSLEEREVVEQWYALLEEEPRELSAKEWGRLENRLWKRLKEAAFGEEDESTRMVPLWRRTVFKASVAASIAVLLVAGFFYNSNEVLLGPVIKSEGEDMKIVVNHGASVMSVLLEDSSKVLLSQEGELRYPKHFLAQKREVFLTGEAFFEVTENANRPFFVNAGQIITKVLGTSFRIKAPENGSNIEVSVKTGKVSVYEKNNEETIHSSKNGNGVILNPNHQVTFIAKSKLFVTRLVDEPVALPEENPVKAGLFNFNDTPLSKVIMQLEQTYRIDLEVERKALGDCPITANLSQKGLYAQLDLLCAAIQGTYEVKGTTILISGKGCE